MRHKYYDQALKTFMVGVHAADPVSAVKRALNGYDEKPTIISVGKAAVKMMSAANEALENSPNRFICRGSDGIGLEGAMGQSRLRRDFRGAFSIVIYSTW